MSSHVLLDDNINGTTYGAEDDYYTSLPEPYRCKNNIFDSKEELMLVRGMSPEIFEKIKKSITVFPKSGRLLINFDTASSKVLTAMARSATGPATNTNISDADFLVRKVLNHRNGDDGIEFTKDDRSIELNEMNFNTQERILFLSMNQYRTKESKYLGVRVKGVEEYRKVTSEVDAIFQREDLTILYWHRN